MNILDRFLKYVSFDTQADPNSPTFPSTLKQHKLGEYLVNELKELGINNAFKDEYGYVYAYLKGDIDKTIGLIAHLDTATEMSGKDVKPIIHKHYDGKDIILPNGLIIKTSDFSFLPDFIGDTIVTTSGDTLLGADDKAGISLIMDVLEKLITNKPSHPNLFIAFTPDEEIGEGTTHFNYDLFKVDFAYTIDGGKIDVINYENFNAATAIITINGISIHPGDALNKMINSQELANQFHQMLPPNDKPEHTSNYQGFYHLTKMQGEVIKTTLQYIIRDHDDQLFQERKALIKNIAHKLNDQYHQELIKVDIIDSYYNMAKLFNNKEYILSYPLDALKLNHIKPSFKPIRGGTDGARLSYGGILCPNLPTGSYNHHGPYEIANINQMELLSKVYYDMLTIVIK